MTAAPRHAQTSLWRTNRWGLVLLVPALLVAVAASSFRLLNLYLPWEPWIDHGSAMNTSVRDEFQTNPLVVSARLVSVSQPPEMKAGAPPNSQAWRVDVRLSAPPTSVLIKCQIDVVDSTGRTFTAITGIDADGRPTFASCTPRDTPGPAGGGTLSDSELFKAPRPPEWTSSWLFLLPADAKPDWLRLAWDAHYLRVQLR